MRVRVDAERVVTVAIDGPTGAGSVRPPVVVLAHGMSNDMDSPFLRFFADGLVRAGFTAVRFNFPYREAGRTFPDRPEVLEAAYRAVLAEVRNRLGPEPPVIGGKSLGSRMATRLAAAAEDVAGLALLGYPLHPKGKPERLRDDHFPHLRVPALFLGGDRDPLCDLDLLRESLRRYPGDARLHVLAGGDHSFKVLRSAGRTDEDVLEEALGVLVDWLGELTT